MRIVCPHCEERARVAESLVEARPEADVEKVYHCELCGEPIVLIVAEVEALGYRRVEHTRLARLEAVERLAKYARLIERRGGDEGLELARGWLEENAIEAGSLTRSVSLHTEPNPSRVPVMVYLDESKAKARADEES